MDHFLRCVLRKTLFLFGAASILLQFDHAVAERLQEEMQTLRMFYLEKDLVVSHTRHHKPINQVAEKISVITAEEIEAMNARTVAKVLNRVAGVFVNFNQDYGKTCNLFTTASIDTAFSEELSVDTALYYFNQKFVQENDALGFGINGPPGDLLLRTTFDEQTFGAGPLTFNDIFINSGSIKRQGEGIIRRNPNPYFA